MTNARHRTMLRVILGETLEQKRFFDQALAGRTDLLGRRADGAGTEGGVLPTRWVELNVPAQVQRFPSHSGFQSWSCVSRFGSNLGDRDGAIREPRSSVAAISHLVHAFQLSSRRSPSGTGSRIIRLI